MSNNEHGERLERIRERARETPHYFTADFHFLLSLLDSEAVDSEHPFGPCGYRYCDWPDGELRCNEPRLNPPMPLATYLATELVDELFNNASALTPTIKGDPCGAGFTANYLVAKIATVAHRTATSMLDLCVEKVKARRDKFQRAADSSSLPNDLTASRDAAVAAAFTRLMGELQSLTLEQEQK